MLTIHIATDARIRRSVYDLCRTYPSVPCRLKELIFAEQSMVSALGWDVSVPTSYKFLGYYKQMVGWTTIR